LSKRKISALDRLASAIKDHGSIPGHEGAEILRSLKSNKHPGPAQDPFANLAADDVIHPVYLAQLPACLKLSGRYICFLSNWNVPHLNDGIQRMIWRER
jgi:hypothetical protein